MNKITLRNLIFALCTLGFIGLAGGKTNAMLVPNSNNRAIQRPVSGATWTDGVKVCAQGSLGSCK